MVEKTADPKKKLKDIATYWNPDSYDKPFVEFCDFLQERWKGDAISPSEFVQLFRDSLVVCQTRIDDKTGHPITHPAAKYQPPTYKGLVHYIPSVAKAIFVDPLFISEVSLVHETALKETKVNQQG